MGIALASASIGIIAGLRVLVRLPGQFLARCVLSTPRGTQRVITNSGSATYHHKTSACTEVATALVPRRAAPVRPLRVVRVHDGWTPRHAAGRMVISGRMADVCAELDRLAQQELA